MNSDAQLSFLFDIAGANDRCDAGKHADVQTPEAGTLSKAEVGAEKPLSYGDIKGRVPIPPKNGTTEAFKPKSPSKPAPHLRGYDAPPPSDESYLSVRDVAKRLSVSVATIWRWSKEDPDFPKPFVIKKGTSRWRKSHLIAFETRAMEA